MSLTPLCFPPNTLQKLIHMHKLAYMHAPMPCDVLCRTLVGLTTRIHCRQRRRLRQNTTFRSVEPQCAIRSSSMCNHACDVCVALCASFSVLFYFYNVHLGHRHFHMTDTLGRDRCRSACVRSNHDWPQRWRIIVRAISQRL